MMNKITNTVAMLILNWCAITLVLNFLLPHSLFFKYHELSVPDTEVCQWDTQPVTGYRWALTNMPSSGVDEIFPVGINIPADRFSWPDGFYSQGNTASTWRPQVNVSPGEYYWANTQLTLYVLYIFPVYLDKDERPVSNVFTVKDCSRSIDLTEEVAQAFETYLEIEGYVVE